MNAIIFGASGMVGQGVLRECLLDPDIQQVVTVVRKPTGVTHDKLREIVHSCFLDFAALEPQLHGLDACFFCLGVSALGLKEAEYRSITFDTTMAAARTLLSASPGLTFEYVSGAGTDSSMKGRLMWARVKGETENALLQMPFKAAYMFRPGMIVPLDGIQSKTPAYRLIYAVLRPLLPLFERLAPLSVTTTQRLGKAMIRAAKNGAPKPVLETSDIHRL